MVPRQLRNSERYLMEGAMSEYKSVLSEIEISEAHQKSWEKLIVSFGAKAPGLRYLLYKMLSAKGQKHLAVFTPDIPTAATNGFRIFINPESFFAYSLREQAFILAHEIMHCVYKDPTLMHVLRNKGSVGEYPYIHNIMNMAMDYRINYFLAKNKDYLEMPLGALYNRDYTSDMSCIEIYKDIMKKHIAKYNCVNLEALENNATTTKSNKSYTSNITEKEKSKKGLKNDVIAKEDNRDWKTEVEIADKIQQQYGDTAGKSLVMKNINPEPIVDWRFLLSTAIQRIADDKYNWRRADRRFIHRDIFIPKKEQSTIDYIVIWCDTSGSVINIVNNFFTEIVNLAYVIRPRKLKVYFNDCAIQNCIVVEDGNYEILLENKNKISGGGGTDIYPVLEDLKKDIKPDVFISLTDGYFSHPKLQDFNGIPENNIIWVISTDEKFDFGHTINVKY